MPSSTRPHYSIFIYARRTKFTARHISARRTKITKSAGFRRAEDALGYGAQDHLRGDRRERLGGGRGTALTPASYPAERVLSRTGGRFRILPEQDEDLADVLNRLRSGLPANLLKDRLASRAIGAVHAHFDQLVAFQTAIDFREDRGRPTSSSKSRIATVSRVPGMRLSISGLRPGAGRKRLRSVSGGPDASSQSIFWKLRRYLELPSSAEISAKKQCFSAS